jgi:hypothetical protein
MVALGITEPNDWKFWDIANQESGLENRGANSKIDVSELQLRVVRWLK